MPSSSHTGHANLNVWAILSSLNREAKAAVLEWSDRSNSVAASSLHSFEDEIHRKGASL